MTKGCAKGCNYWVKEAVMAVQNAQVIIVVAGLNESIESNGVNCLYTDTQF